MVDKVIASFPLSLFNLIFRQRFLGKLTGFDGAQEHQNRAVCQIVLFHGEKKV